jgi:hypothetical protein
MVASRCSTLRHALSSGDTIGPCVHRMLHYSAVNSSGGPFPLSGLWPQATLKNLGSVYSTHAPEWNAEITHVPTRSFTGLQSLTYSVWSLCGSGVEGLPGVVS